VAATEIVVKKYSVKLGTEERERLDSVVHSGKPPARKLMKAPILLKADAGEAGEGWSDSQIAKALDTSLATIARRPPAACGARVRGRADSQALAGLGQDALLRWRRGSQTHRPGLFKATKRPYSMDVEPAGRQGCRTAHCGGHHPLERYRGALSETPTRFVVPGPPGDY
jgi:hypothetical protein